ncbi:DUF368 domain-containing protein [Robertkochia solimangrovi]|uniref:DUF368 domain-containing protein n=1 Tax=Robertkochia solimangrovi TaxID=2213046 RepID=UPI0011816EB8|nr:DUF368 domain-containing protein [Robertkochia solimangrovi]TRZ43612.1 DUF368 domain-containing protein [Robertkochia solimangrovi]
MQRKLTDYVIITLKGLAMGAADVVPGVSGGTIAFISGIYEELIETINKVDLKAFKILRQNGIKAAWNYMNGNFLAALLLGIGISVLSLAKLLKWLLANEPVLLWSFFFGLVLASVILVGSQIEKWNWKSILVFIAGAVGAFYITTLPPMHDTSSDLFLLIAGALAICAMILPGISGAFILVLLGAYETVLEAVSSMDIKKIVLFAIGAVVGLLSFSRLLKFLFHRFKNITLAALTGFIFGSLNKIWPWKIVTETRIFKEKVIPISEHSVLPSQFDGDPQLFPAVLLAIGGFALIFLLERLAVKKS